MKIKFILFTIIFGITILACHDLSLEPKGILGEPELFGNEYGVKKYFTGLYNYLPIEDFVYYADRGYRPDNYWETGKFSQGNMSGEFFNTWILVDNDGFAYWPYNLIREVNTFIQYFPDYRNNYDEATFNALLGEAHFLRAFYYFGLAKRYGGIPLIKTVQNPVGDKDSLMVFRNTEYDTWKFIHDDLEFAMNNMPKNSETGRANKFVAAALMSRAMLYAGSIAKYSQYLGFESEAAFQQGLVGMDPAKADEFFQYSYNASRMIIEEGSYSLYEKEADKALNFARLFMDPSSPENIFIKDYDKTAPYNTRLRHNYDALMCPYPDMSSFVGAESYPPLDFIKLYEFPDITDAEGKPIRFNDRGDIRNGMEPRLRGTMYFNGDELRGHIFDIQRGIYLSFDGMASDAQEGSNDAPINKTNRILGNRGDLYQGHLVTGRHGLFENQGGENNCITGAFVRKYVDENLPATDVRDYTSGQPWIVFRLGEIYLNCAEAAYELNKKSEAFDCIKVIRERAGCNVVMPPDNSSVSTKYGYPIDGNLQFIREERVRELYGENHWWWDLRRWRIVDRVLNNFRPRSLSCYYILDENKYIYLDEINKFNRTWTAAKSAMYEPIPWGEINKNTNLLPQNPLY